ncbi:MAG: 50S ribosomal protein L6 [Bacteroidetes bacterium]|nr:50S ribosomal protein L6 [Bacteroidota bacterium]
MSRIGKLPIHLPKGVTLTISDKNLVTVKGPLGTLEQNVDPAITVNVNEADALITVQRPTDQNRHRALHGLYRSLINNMVKGVSEGFTTVQEIIGVGYKASSEGRVLELALGYSHNIFMELPKEVTVETTAERGKNPTIILKSHDKQLLGQVATKIRSLRKPEPYKGKGIRFMNEVVRKKAGKAAASK